MLKKCIALLCLLACGAAAQASEEQVDHGHFGTVTIYHPDGAPRSVVLFLSGDGGWNLGVIDMAKLLVAQGALVVGISVPEWQKRLETAGGDCLYPDGDLEELSHFVQASARLPTYYSPYLVGFSSGASYTYAMLAQAPEDTFAGGISVGFCQDIELHKPMCKGEDLHFTTRSDGKGVDLKPGAKLRNPWAVLHGEVDQVCPINAARAFVSATPDATLVSLPKVGHGYSVAPNWAPQFVAAFNSMEAKHRAAALPPPPPSLAGLPLVEVPAQGPQGDYFAVMLSGDGGWAGMDKEIASELTAQGIPVAGWDSLRYFWTARTPAGLAGDLDRVLRYYADRWKKGRAIVIGYSQGADVVSFGINRLPASSRPLLAESVMIAPGLLATFEFHFGNWFGGSTGGIPIPPEAEKLDAAHTLCIYGQDETDSLCPGINGKSAHSVALPGGHHFNGDYKRVAAEVLARVRDAKAPAKAP
jgi:type IV secretory pathway VirJ component